MLTGNDLSQRSIWLARHRFVQAADGSFTMAEIVTNLQAIINDERRVQIDDFDGRGTSSVAVKLMNGLDGFNRYELWPLDQLGLYRSRETAEAPDLLVGAERNRSGRRRVLAAPAALAEGRARVRHVRRILLYGQPRRSPLPGIRLLHRLSILPGTVSGFEMSNGPGASTNRTCYRYKDAMLDGRGQGVARASRPSSRKSSFRLRAGEDATAAPSQTGCGDSPGAVCSPNNLRTTTEFYQEFPLTSRLKTETVAYRSTGQPLRKTTHWWHTVQPGTSGGAWLVHAAATDEIRYETGGGPLASEVVSVSEYDAAVTAISGDARRTCVAMPGTSPSARS